MDASHLPHGELYTCLEGLDAQATAALDRTIRSQGGEIAIGRGGTRAIAVGAAVALARAAETLHAAGQPFALALSTALRQYRTARLAHTRTLIVGILNVTPDSFSDGGQFLTSEQAVARGEEMLADGADVLDIGGESTRPGAEEVPLEEELRRVLPVIEALVRIPEARISVDTRRAEVAARCLDVGAWMVNDVSAGMHDPPLLGVVARAGARLALMHMRGVPATMQEHPVYEDVVADTARFLRERCAVALEAGVAEELLWIDPGFGFGKTVTHNLQILQRLREYTALGPPVLIGTSRKSTLGRVLGGAFGDLPVTERLEATAATVAAAIMNGACAVRVHDVRAMARVARMTEAIRDVPPAESAA
ncbi:MAG: dihydropteroate synthase [Armatimonadetes bacterium]|nr:dihydropteroate synthase [Armatimonadota bacterium]